MSTANANRVKKVVLGTMTFGDQVDVSLMNELISVFVDWNGKTSQGTTAELDTALLYCGGNTEKQLSEGPQVPECSVAIKSNPWFGKMDKAGVLEQVNTSLASLKQTSAHTLYLHAPDPRVTVDEILDAVAELHEAGTFERFGLSNSHATEVDAIVEKCKERGMIVPTVYQGMYNATTRQVEEELIPTLRKHNMAFYAYNPLAGGVLTGKHKFDAEPEEGTRFNNSKNGDMYKDRFWRKDLFEALEEVFEECKNVDIPPVEASLRWLSSHSLLSSEFGDAVIIGASSKKHLESNLASFEVDEPLPEAVVAKYDAAWKVMEPNCPSYFRGYTGSEVGEQKEVIIGK